MSWKVHLNLSMAVAVGLFLLGLWCGHEVLAASPFGMFVCGALLSIAGRFGFRALVTALCPSCGRPGARQVGSRPIAYECGDCGHRHDTGIYEGSHRI